MTQLTPTSCPYKTALVTGSAARIGRVIALGLAEIGIAVVVHHRNSAEKAAELVEEIHAGGGRAAAIGGDLSDVTVMNSLVSDAASAIGAPIDILINNASVFEQDTVFSMTTKSWQQHQAVNLQAPVSLAQKLFEQLPEGAPGCVINMIDQRVLKLNPQYFSYTTAKAGLWTATRTMAQAMAPRVRVNAISPGPTLANQFQTPGDFDTEAANTLLGHGPAIGEIVSGVKFLLETASMTGQMLTLDGGQHLAWRTADIIED